MELDGRFQIYTGNGKGKTTAALGLAVRAACAGYRVYIGQFMKGRNSSELALPEHFPGLISIEQYGSPRLIGKGEKPDAVDLGKAKAGLDSIGAAMLSGDYDLVVADEINVAVHMGLIDESEVVDLARKKPGKVELVFTGRHAPQTLIDEADLVTEMKEVKHYYAAEGLEARKGIET